MRTTAFASIAGWWQLLLSRLSMLFHIVSLTLISMFLLLQPTKISKDYDDIREILIFWGFTFQNLRYKGLWVKEKPWIEGHTQPSAAMSCPPSRGELPRSREGGLRAKGALHLKNWGSYLNPLGVCGEFWDFCSSNALRLIFQNLGLAVVFAREGLLCEFVGHVFFLPKLGFGSSSPRALCLSASAVHQQDSHDGDLLNDSTWKKRRNPLVYGTLYIISVFPVCYV